MIITIRNQRTILELLNPLQRVFVAMMKEFLLPRNPNHRILLITEAVVIMDANGELIGDDLKFAIQKWIGANPIGAGPTFGLERKLARIPFSPPSGDERDSSRNQKTAHDIFCGGLPAPVAQLFMKCVLLADS
jgi:hypothetical protein